MSAGGSVLHRYAAALHQLAAAEGAETLRSVGEDLGGLTASLQEHVELQAQFASPRMTRDKKRTLIGSLITGRVHDLVRRTLLLLVDKGRAGQIVDLGPAYATVADAAAGRLHARVESATALDDDRRTRLVAELSRLTGQSVLLSEQVVPELLGGLRVHMGSRLIDASTQHHLDQLKERLLNAPLGALAKDS